MNHDPTPISRGELLDQLAGLTGIGWTVSMLGFLSAVLDVGRWNVAHLGADPAPLLAVGVVLFATTVGLDRLGRTVEEDDTGRP